MLTFTVTRDPSLLAEEDIYRFLPLKNLNELLKEEHSLCLVRHPEWCGKQVPLQRIRGELSGKAESIFYHRGQGRFQSSVKNALDRNLATSYLFSLWKKSGVRTFKVIQKGRILEEFDDFESALASLIPGNFIPQFEYQRKLPIMGILLLQEKRAQERREHLDRLLESLQNRKEV